MKAKKATAIIKKLGKPNPQRAAKDFIKYLKSLDKK